MKKFIFLSFLFMAWSFYELSDGADFVPASTRMTAQSETSEDNTAEKSAFRPDASVQVPAPAVSVENTQQTDPAPDLVSVAATMPEPETPPVEASPTEISVAAEEPEVVFSLASLEEAPEFFLSKPDRDIRTVQGFQANMRSGPGTDFHILDQLAGGTEVEILEDPGEGWIKIRRLDVETSGWVSATLLGPQQ